MTDAFTLEKVLQELGRGNQISIVSLLNYLIEHAQHSGASDIHIDPTPTSVRVRLRIDGVLQESFSFPQNIHSEIISRIKVVSKLRTDEHQATQDGRFRYNFFQSESFLDIRVSIIPTYYGENAVLRLLSDTAAAFTLASLGFSNTDTEKITHALKRSSGMILSTGPTGSGKTTTLYTLIKMLNSPEVSIVTIEDPIEYAVTNIEQIQVNTKTGLTFANGLRSILRQDPDIIMVGEIRDTETAGIAVNTALTGHLLLSTLHTSDAATTLPRLLDMGIEAYLIASTVNIAIGQRLVRKICTHCKEKISISPSMRETFHSTPSMKIFEHTEFLYKGKGCEICNQSGYNGRISINEVLVADDDIKDAIVRKANANEIKKIAILNGMTTMLADGCEKVLSGLTTLDEIFRVIYE